MLAAELAVGGPQERRMPARDRGEAFRVIQSTNGGRVTLTRLCSTFPKFVASRSLHRDLSTADEKAEGIAATVPLKQGEHFA
jgi:hypothetical protein